MILNIGISLNFILRIIIRLFRKEYFYDDAKSFYNNYHKSL